jgi:heme-degrading monooxygenase HmoA
MAYVYIWEYRVRAEEQARFEAGYGPDGEWARLFRRGAGYLRTELLKDRDDPTRYVTIDRWESFEAFSAFRRELGAEFEAIDRRFESITAEEAKVGEFDVAG